MKMYKLSFSEINENLYIIYLGIEKYICIYVLTDWSTLNTKMWKKYYISKYKF